MRPYGETLRKYVVRGKPVAWWKSLMGDLSAYVLRRTARKRARREAKKEAQT